MGENLYDDDFIETIKCFENRIDGYNEWCPKRIVSFKEAVLPNMRVGINKAMKRFGSHLYAYDIFWRVADAINKHSILLNSPDYEGQTIRLHYSFEKAFCEEVYPEDDYEENDYE